jgi:PiT family inorganic phosphate transporter
MSYFTLIFIAAIFLSYANGANDNFKGVATLFGSGTTGYKKALAWATLTTFAGSICSIFLAATLIKNFSGKGLVPEAITTSPNFMLAVALAAGCTVILATFLSFPISTTHGITGALIGAGLVAAGTQINFAKLGGSFFLPLLVSPLIALTLGVLIYLIAHAARVASGVNKEWCVCVGEVTTQIPITEHGSMLAASPMVLPNIQLATWENCSQRYVGNFAGVSVQKVLDSLHFLSAGSVSFARGLNDTPKLVAFLLLIQALDVRSGMLAVALGMGVGGLISARRVAVTMSKKITPMTHGQGLAANLVTSGLVIFASRLGLPVSTTHVSCGSLFGMGLVTRQANVRVIREILLSWILTLPVAAVLSAGIYWLTTQV